MNPLYGKFTHSFTKATFAFPKTLRSSRNNTSFTSTHSGRRASTFSYLQNKHIRELVHQRSTGISWPSHIKGSLFLELFRYKPGRLVFPLGAPLPRDVLFWSRKYLFTDQFGLLILAHTDRPRICTIFPSAMRGAYCVKVFGNTKAQWSQTYLPR